MDNNQTLPFNGDNLRKTVQTQIDKVVFIHDNPDKMEEVERSLPRLSRNPSGILARCITRMERLNSLLVSPELSSQHISIETQLENIYERRKGTFNPNRCYILLTRNRAIDTMSSKKRRTVRTKDRTLSYEFREKLTGFLSRRGNTLWSNEKIDDFIHSIMN